MEKIKYIPGDLVRVEDSANWWTKDGTIMKISAVNCTDMVDVLCGSENYTVNINAIISIPLTAKLLKKNGWYSNDEGSYSISGYVDLELEKNREKWYVIINHYFLSIEIRYVHELQHLMFSLDIDHYLKA